MVAKLDGLGSPTETLLQAMKQTAGKSAQPGGARDEHFDFVALAIALWGNDRAGAGLYLVTDHTKPSTDQRREIAPAPGERDLVLQEMRRNFWQALMESLSALPSMMQKMEDSARASVNGDGDRGKRRTHRQAAT